MAAVAGCNPGRIAYDVDPASPSVTLDAAVGGHPAGSNLAAGVAAIERGVVEVALDSAVDLAATDATLRVSVGWAAMRRRRRVHGGDRNGPVCLSPPARAAARRGGQADR